MSKVVRFWLIILSTVIWVYPQIVLADTDAATPARILITELQTEGSEVPPVLSEEFIELTNVSSETVDITGWELQTKSTASITSAWTRLIVLSGQLYPKGSILLSHNGYLDSLAAAHFGSSISSNSGHLRLVVSPTATTVEDKLGWGGALATYAEGQAAPKPTAGSTLTRKLVDGQYVDTDSNVDDFILALASPNNENEEPAPDPVVTPTDPLPTEEPSIDDPIVDDPAEELPPLSETDTPPVVPSSPPIVIPSIPEEPQLPTITLPPGIVEIFPDPVAPQDDANDEYVELYNPNSIALSLDGYKVQSGSTFSHTVTLDGMSIAANGYLALIAGDTNLVLSNSGGAVRIVTPEGNYLHTISYAEVEPGHSYALSAGLWEWTTTVTPGMANVITAPPVEIPVLKTAVTKIAKAATPKKTTGSLATAKAAATPKAAVKTSAAKKTTSIIDASRSVFEDPAALSGDPPVHPAALVGISTLAVLYAAYEYREDFRNRLFKFRAYARARLRRR